MIFHENRLLADDSHVISYLIFGANWKKVSQNLSSAAVVIDTLRVNAFLGRSDFCCLLITFANSLDPDLDRQNDGPDLDLNPFTS